MSTLPPVVYQDDEVSPAAVTDHIEIGKGGAFNKPAIGWWLFEFGRNPWYLLVSIYIFVPYVATEMTGGGAEGQATIAGVVKTAGLIAAFSAPFLGAMVDRGGRRKPLMFAILGLLAICSWMLWFAQPGDVGLGLMATLALIVVAKLSYAYSEVLHNAMLPLSGRPEAHSHISGLGLSMGNIAGVLLFAFMLWAFLIPGSGLDLPGLPDAPLFGIDPSLNEPQRLVGPLAAVWIVVFTIPFFLFMPDGARPGGTWTQAAKEMLGATGEMQNPFQRVTTFIAYIRRLFVESPEVMRFLLARMIYADGLAVVITLVGVYVATFFGWKGAEMPLFAIWTSVFASFGGILGGRLDNAFGARKALIIELVLLLACFVAQLSITDDGIFFGLIPVTETLWAVDIFNRSSDWVFLFFVGMGAVFITAALSSSRYMLLSVSPPGRTGEFFGLYAVVGTVTVWIGPMMVEVLTRIFDSQRIGMTAPVILFAAGIAILLTCKAEGRPGEGARLAEQSNTD